MGGPLTGGDPGVRLIEPTPSEKNRLLSKCTAGFKPRAGEWLLVPLHHIFGTEELSITRARYRRARRKPYLALNPDDASDLGLAAGDERAIAA